MSGKIASSFIFTNQESQSFLDLQLPICQDYYQNCCCYMNEMIFNNGYSESVAFLVKKAFDYILMDFNNQQHSLLLNKQDLYMHYIILRSLKHLKLIELDQFNIKFQQLQQQFNPNQDQTLYIQRIQISIQKSLKNTVSPFDLLEKEIKQDFTQKQKQIVIQIMKYCISYSTWYLMKPQIMFGLALYQFLKFKKTNPQTINKMISNYLDLNSPYILKKIKEVSQIVGNILETDQN